MKNEAKIRKNYYRKVKDIREFINRKIKMKELEQQKRKEQEELL
jgi:hypothetical protein